MKRIKIAAIATVMIFGIGGAVIASNSTQTANVMNTGTEENPNWQPITPGHKGCDNETERPCLGYRATPTSTPVVLAFGNQIP